MVGLVERRISKSAIWCRRLAVFAIPYFLITILLHRWDKITTNQAMASIGVGVVLLLIAIVLAMLAITRLWVEGAKGGKAMTLGLFLSLVMLAPFLYFAVQATIYPPLNDITTNGVTAPQFGDAIINARRGERVTPENNVAEPFTLGETESIAIAYPKVGPRRYPAGAERVYRAARALVADRGWKVMQVRGLKQDTKTGTEKDPAVISNAESGLEGGVLPDLYIDALSSTLIFAFRNDVVVQIISEDENTLVQMRAASRWGSHDFGHNANIIESFLHDLDQSLIGIAGEG